MTSRDFCYWLQGVFEGGQVTSLNEEQVKIISDHLAMVFVHEIDPSFPLSQQQALTEAHDSSGKPNFPGAGARC
ncbi:hypothetical protein [Nostoc sp.]|uniref:hypothetical protein n=1 Tax=Nostoc sp. TaxID=1180 RepID=UPI002FEEEE20